jgi:ketosteroid isomerase-like protein
MWMGLIKMIPSTQKGIVQTYIDGFQELDHPKILDCLTEDVIWEIHGHRKLQGKKAFDEEIENENFEGKPVIHLNRLTEENQVVIAEGTVVTKPKNQDPIEIRFCDIFEFENGKIKKLSSYLAPYLP